MATEGGTTDQPIYPRSAVKPLQALPLIESGAADHYALSEREIALACASHSGEPDHVRCVAGWLTRIGLSCADLECGAHPPYDGAAQKALIRSGAAPTPCHNNCSGKHAGFLSTARFLGEPVAGYIQPGHPVQQRVRQALADMCDTPLGNARSAIDGCGIPVFGIPLRALALAMARMVTGEGLSDARRAAARRICAAMTREPFMVAGSSRFCTLAMQSARGALVVKTGAEGVFLAGLPQRGLGIALKIDDGAHRGSEAALAGLIDRIGAVDDTVASYLRQVADQPLRNRVNRVVGAVRCAPDWIETLPQSP